MAENIGKSPYHPFEAIGKLSESRSHRTMCLSQSASSEKSAVIRYSERPAINRATTNRGTLKIREIRVIRVIRDSDKHVDTAPSVSIFQAPKSAIQKDPQSIALLPTETLLKSEKSVMQTSLFVKARFR